MRSITILFVAAFILPIALNAQKKVTAESIIKSINNHQAVVISDAQITGDLDFTRLDNMKQEKQNSPGKIYISTVTVPVNFKNCTFTGKVLGYFNPDYNRPLKKSSTVYNANFTAAVNFEDCSFDEEVNFKYSVFSTQVSFAGSKFGDEGFFKYAKFEEGPNFKNTTFKSDAVFKYVEFPSASDFSNAVFESGADFKYAKFMNGGSFAKAEFKNGSDFKYANFSKVSFSGANFSGNNDFKYTTVDDRHANLNELVSE
jgi:uncharacterized protein YjbI with pentapeptide repeats